MTNQKLGLGYAVGFSEEAAFGTPAATCDNWIHAYPGVETLSEEVDEIIGEDVQQRAPEPEFVDPGMRRLGGNVAPDLQFGGGWLMWIAHLLGIDAATTGAGPYVHTIPIGKALGGADDITAKGITLFADREGQKASAAARASAFAGVRPVAAEFTFEMNKRVRMAVEIIGRSVSSVTRLTPSLPSRPWIIAPSKNAAPSPFFTWAATPYKVTGGTFRIEQAWKGDDDDLQSPLIREPHIDGECVVTASLDVETPEVTASSGGIWRDDYRSKEHKAAVLTMNGPDANSILAITLHKARVTNKPEPQIAGYGRIRQTVELRGAFDSANAQIGALALTSLDSAPWA